jgi:hypothetical protein
MEVGIILILDWIEWNKNSSAILYKMEFRDIPIATKIVGIIKASVKNVNTLLRFR